MSSSCWPPACWPRPPPPARLTPVASRRLLVGAAALLCAIAGGLIAVGVAGGSDAGPPASLRRTPAPAETTAPSSAAPTTDPVANAVIAASAPLHLRVPAISLDGAVTEYTQQMIDDRDGFDPLDLSTISWDTTIAGGLAGTDSANTVYLYGHSWVDAAVFNGLKEMNAGDLAAVDTANGTLCYQAQKTLTLDKAEYKSNDELTNAIPNRLVLVSCYRPVGYDPNSATVKNIVVVLQLDQNATNAGC
ncbi:class F sortase [Cryobacterium sp. HLT2-28]|uniref:class F sortase n=1 Tax=Cryobacterium sp. HLT2-28 TaxID=1259146 RepID=UPI00141B0E7E|nr:class F sortase [Cryobacterium sp. HLT2-28]